MNPFERTDPKTFLSRYYLTLQLPNIRPLSKRVCPCMLPYNPDDPLTACALCGFIFHPGCSAHHDLCITCH